MSNYKIIENESDVVISDVDHVRIRICINDERKDRINLKFIRTTIEDFFCNLSLWSEKNKIKIKEDIIKILSENSNNLLNKFVAFALDDLKVKQQLENREIGQFMIKPEHFNRKDYRDNLK